MAPVAMVVICVYPIEVEWVRVVAIVPSVLIGFIVGIVGVEIRSRAVCAVIRCFGMRGPVASRRSLIRCFGWGAPCATGCRIAVVGAFESMGSDPPSRKRMRRATGSIALTCESVNAVPSSSGTASCSDTKNGNR